VQDFKDSDIHQFIVLMEHKVENVTKFFEEYVAQDITALKF